MNRRNMLGRPLWVGLVAGLWLGACGDDSGGDTPMDGGGANPDNIVPLATVADAEVSLDRVMYGDGDEANVTMRFFGAGRPTAPSIEVVLAAPDSGDVETVTLDQVSAGEYASSAGVLIRAAGSAPVDGALSVGAGRPFHAMYFLDRAAAGAPNLAADLYSDIGFLERLDPTTGRVEAAAALTDNEAVDSGRPVGTLLRDGELPVQIATEELLYWARDDADLQAFVTRVGGTLLQTRNLEPGDTGASYESVSLVAVTPALEEAERLPMLDELMGFTDPMLGSNEAALAMVSFVLQLRLDGLVAAVHPRLQYQGAPTIGEFTNLGSSMRNEGPDRNCLPGDATNPCVQNAPSAWAYMALFGADRERVNVAVLDMGFAPNADFRSPAVGAPVECDMTASPVVCGPGRAQGAPTVGNSFFGDRSWHGTGVTHTLGGVVNNGVQVAGTGGQVAVPMLYKYDTAAYVFDIGAGIDRAVADGASCINISGGYPCNIVTTVGPDFNICTASGRTGICAVVTASLAVAAAAVCAATSFIPIAGAIACGAATSGVVAATGACLSTLAFGNLGSPMYWAVAQASREGVPVVTSAGNRIGSEALPPVIRSLVNLNNIRVEDWGVMPAMAPDAVVVGAVGSIQRMPSSSTVTTDSLSNIHFIGNRVDLWAPIRTNYFAPMDVNNPASMLELTDIGGTSAAAPYVTGVVANMQAVNRDLNPRTPGLTAAEKRTIVARIKAILSNPANSFSNAELVALGFTSDADRRVLVDPLRAVMAAGQSRALGAHPDLGALGYDTTLGFSEQTGDDDAVGRARELPFDTELTGTILQIPDPSGSVSMPDVDWFSFRMPASTRASAVDVTLSTPSAISTPIGFSSASRPPLRISSFEWRFVGASMELVTFALGGGPNVYKVEAASPVPAPVEVELLAPANGSTVCANEDIVLSADAYYRDVRSSGASGPTVSNSNIVWQRVVPGGTSLFGIGRTLIRSFTEGAYNFELTAFGDPTTAVDLSIQVVDCSGNPPTARIVNPAADILTQEGINAFDGFDAVRGQSYTDFFVSASVSDIEDGVLPGASIVWKTDRTDLQSATLGTGATRTIRLYAPSGSSAETHSVTVEATDSDGNTTTSSPRRLLIWTLI